MKINKKGFTLIELLIVIAVLGLVLSVGVYFTIKSIKKSKDTALALTEKNVLEAARIYSVEDPNLRWNKKTDDTDNEYFCTTVYELRNKGLIPSKVDNLNSFNDKYIIVQKNYNTKAIETINIVSLGSPEGEFCDDVFGTFTIDYYDDKDILLTTQEKHGFEIVALNNGTEYNDLKPYYDLNSWNTKKDGSGTKYDLGGEYSEAANLVLYGHWVPKKYTITLNYSCGSEYKDCPDSQVETVEYPQTQATFKLPELYKYGYDYVWMTGTGVEIDSDTYTVGNINYGGDQEETVYAEFTNELINGIRVMCKNDWLNDGVWRTPIFYIDTCTRNDCLASEIDGYTQIDSNKNPKPTAVSSYKGKNHSRSELSPISAAQYCRFNYYAIRGMNCYGRTDKNSNVVRNISYSCTPIKGLVRTDKTVSESSSWYYYPDYDCYLEGTFLTETKPSCNTYPSNPDGPDSACYCCGSSSQNCTFKWGDYSSSIGCRRQDRIKDNCVNPASKFGITTSGNAKCECISNTDCGGGFNYCNKNVNSYYNNSLHMCAFRSNEESTPDYCY